MLSQKLNLFSYTLKVTMEQCPLPQGQHYTGGWMALTTVY